ncbi:hypothetical protein AB9K34_06510 [Sedimentitalea sp. XS_ASV28]|uniref:hypothetical protein n=1 Tax=Sedimentitalea sp. XS_ASV28 TaxID=3241296 RepID=UPI0035150B17
MTLITPEERISRSADILRSLEESILSLRKRAEDLRLQLEAGEDANLVAGSKDLLEAEKLISSCRRVEMSLDEHYRKKAGIAQGGYALDLDAARSEIGSRLARIRNSRAS